MLLGCVCACGLFWYMKGFGKSGVPRKNGGWGVGVKWSRWKTREQKTKKHKMKTKHWRTETLMCEKWSCDWKPRLLNKDTEWWVSRLFDINVLNNENMWMTLKKCNTKTRNRAFVHKWTYLSLKATEASGIHDELIFHQMSGILPWFDWISDRPQIGHQQISFTPSVPLLKEPHNYFLPLHFRGMQYM